MNAKKRKKTRWEHFPHQSDIGIRGIGPAKEKAFEQAAVAMTAVITEPDKIKESRLIEISCEAVDDEILLVNWLNGLIYEMATRRMLFGRFEVHIEGKQLTAKAWGEEICVLRHTPAVEVKAATYTSLNVRQDENGNWIAQCVVDV